jgi:hypothetical protein
MPRIELESLEQEKEVSESSAEIFDRIAFAERVIALVRPPKTRVAICEGRRRVHVESGRQWGSGKDARWAVVRVPPDASRRAIAQAVLGLYAAPSRDDDGPYRSGAPTAWALDVLMLELGGAR